MVELVHHRHLAGKVGEGDRFFKGRITAAHHRDLLPGKKIPVTGGTVRDPRSLESLLTRNVQRSGPPPGGQDHCPGPERPSILEPDPLLLPLQVISGDPDVRFDPASERFGLLLHGPCQHIPAGGFHPGIVGDLIGQYHLPPHRPFVEDQGGEPGTGSVDAGGQSGRPGTHNDHIIPFFHGSFTVDLLRKRSYAFSTLEAVKCSSRIVVTWSMLWMLLVALATDPFL